MALYGAHSIENQHEQTIEKIYYLLDSDAKGLSYFEANQRLKKYGYNKPVSTKEQNIVIKFLLQFINPLTIALISVAILSFFVGQKIDAIIIVLMAVLSVVLAFIQEHNASRVAKKLNELINVTALVLRDGKKIELPIAKIVPGDIIELSVGKMIPADARIISSNNFTVNQSAINGESFPIEKREGESKTQPESIFDTVNLAFMGSSVASGSATAIVLATGIDTEFGKISLHLSSKKKDASPFNKGITSFTYFMIRLIAILVAVIFLANVLLKGSPLESILFALAVAVGLTPEMLPMIVTINLSKGASAMAKKKVIVKELAAIQNFGAMDVLCTDKTGTLTLDEVALFDYEDPLGHKNENVFEKAYINSFFQSGLDNLLDTAVIEYKKINLNHMQKVGEIPFDFSRRLMSVIVKEKTCQIISKGAPEEVIDRSTHFYADNKITKINPKHKDQFFEEYNQLSQKGFRVLGIAYKDIDVKHKYSTSDEKDLIFAGFISFLDPPKPSAKKALGQLEDLGISVKILTGDNELVTRRICDELKLPIMNVLTGKEIDELNDEDLKDAVEQTNIFTRLTPSNKERVIEALKNSGHTVGFLGDGINDSPSIKGANVGISVNNASDIAKEAAEIILLEKDLTILADCVTEGRITFGNSIKYIKMSASSNFGNMFSMAGASFFLPFLPMLPTQILLNNFLYDMSQVSLPADNVDAEYIEKPRPWNIDFIKRFIVFVGPISSIFDFMTFGIMLFILNASPAMFQTGWFIESLTTQILVIYIIRTNKIPFIESRPSKTLVIATASIVLFGMLLPYTFLGNYFGFQPLPILFFGALIIISTSYLFLIQFVKNIFLKKYND